MASAPPFVSQALDDYTVLFWLVVRQGRMRDLRINYLRGVFDGGERNCAPAA
jgi:hypothetical protein